MDHPEADTDRTDTDRSGDEPVPAGDERGGAGPAPRTIAVLGGGLAGLSVAHRLVMWNRAHADHPERQFDITVYEARGAEWEDLGGKCRSWRRTDAAADGSECALAFPGGLPGEHGFRFFPGFYQNVTATLAEIPRDGSAEPAASFEESVASHLVPLPEAVFYSERLEPEPVDGAPWQPSAAAATASRMATLLGYFLGLAWMAAFVVAVSYDWWPKWTLVLWPVAAAVWMLLRWALESAALDVDAELTIGLPIGSTDDEALSEEIRAVAEQAQAERSLIRRRFYGPLLVGFPLAVAACVWTDAGWPMYVAAVALGLAMVVFPRTTLAGYWFWRTMRGSVPFDVRPRVLESMYAALMVLQIMVSCRRRMEGQWDATSWWAYIGAPRFSSEYRVVLATGLTRAFVATRAEQMSARTGGGILAQLLFDINPFLNRDRPADRILDGPTSEVWLRPWVDFLAENGVRLNERPPGTQVKGVPGDSVLVQRLRFDESANRIEGFQANLRAQGRDGRPDAIDAIIHSPDAIFPDHFSDYVLAAGTNAAQRILGNSLDLTRHDRSVRGDARRPRHHPALCHRLPFLDGTFQLELGWMSGIVFVARSTDADLELPLGHLLLMDSEWALTVIEQRAFWSANQGIPEEWRVISVNVSDWFSPSDGGVPARFANLGDLRVAVWEQLCRHVDTVHVPAPPAAWVIRDEAIAEEDPDKELAEAMRAQGVTVAPPPMNEQHRVGAPFERENLPLTNADQLLINTARSWEHRPCAETTIDNLYLAGDHVRTHADFASMESADESARWATRALLTDTFAEADPEALEAMPEPPKALGEPTVIRPGLYTMRAIDEALLRLRLPNLLGVVAVPFGWVAGLEHLFRTWWEGLFRPRGLPRRPSR